MELFFAMLAIASSIVVMVAVPPPLSRRPEWLPRGSFGLAVLLLLAHLVSAVMLGSVLMDGLMRAVPQAEWVFPSSDDAWFVAVRGTLLLLVVNAWPLAMGLVWGLWSRRPRQALALAALSWIGSLSGAVLGLIATRWVVAALWSPAEEGLRMGVVPAAQALVMGCGTLAIAGSLLGAGLVIGQVSWRMSVWCAPLVLGVVLLTAGLLTPPDLLTQILAAMFMVAGWTTGAATGALTRQVLTPRGGTDSSPGEPAPGSSSPDRPPGPG